MGVAGAEERLTPGESVPTSNPSPLAVVLRQVREADLPFFFEHQRDPEATRMAAFPGRDRVAFDAHWARILADETVFARAIEVGGDVAGNVVSFEAEGERDVGYWIGRQHWGSGIASAALSAFLTEVEERPLFARVAKHNLASIRVLEKCGFTPIRRETAPDGIEELVFELPASD